MAVTRVVTQNSVKKETDLNVNETIIGHLYSSFVRMAPEEHCVLFVYRRSFFTLAGVCKNQRAWTLDAYRLQETWQIIIRSSLPTEHLYGRASTY